MYASPIVSTLKTPACLSMSSSNAENKWFKRRTIPAVGSDSAISVQPTMSEKRIDTSPRLSDTTVSPLTSLAQMCGGKISWRRFVWAAERSSISWRRFISRTLRTRAFRTGMSKGFAMSVLGETQEVNGDQRDKRRGGRMHRDNGCVRLRSAHEQSLETLRSHWMMLLTSNSQQQSRRSLPVLIEEILVRHHQSQAVQQVP